MSVVFLDRSNVNGHDDYARAPVTHLYLKVSEGTGFVDATFIQRRTAAHAAGARVGGYHFAGHGDPVAEADHFLSLVGTPKPGQLRPALDLESGQGIAFAEAFVRRLRAKLGYWPVLYGSTSFIGPMRAQSKVLRKCPWWRAEFGRNDGEQHPLVGGDSGAVAHQFTSRAVVPGIAGFTDQSAILNQKPLLVPSPAVYLVVRAHGKVVAQVKAVHGHVKAFMRKKLPDLLKKFGKVGLSRVKR